MTNRAKNVWTLVRNHLEFSKQHQGKVDLPSHKPNMRPKFRKTAIVEFVERCGKASVEELADRFSTSPETVRRDLKALAGEGRVRKVHGGVVKISPRQEGPFDERLGQNILAKQLIAEKLTKAVLPGQSILIDTGSTTLIGAEALARLHDLTVVTNSTRIAHAFASKANGATVILLGGTYRHDNAQTVGPTTCAEIERFRTKHAILTIGTLDTRGAFDYSLDEAEVARAMITAADLVTVVADRSKLNRSSTFQVCELGQIDRLILDHDPGADLLKQLESAGVDVL